MRWTIGEISITKIVESEAGAEMAVLIPDATPDAVRAIDWLAPAFATVDGILLYSFHALVVETPSITMIIDTCVGDDKPRPLVPMWDRMQTGFLTKLAEARFRPEDIDVVVCTHLHLDHVGWNTRLIDGKWMPTFPRARYLFGKREYDFWRAEVASGREDDMTRLQHDVNTDSIDPIVDAGLADFVEDDHVICPEVRLRPSPGHTPGHVCVELSSGGATALITGDSMHHPCQLAHPEWGTIADHDAAQAEQTRRQLLADVEVAGTLVVGTHWPSPTSGYVRRDGIAFRLEGVPGETAESVAT